VAIFVLTMAIRLPEYKAALQEHSDASGEEALRLYQDLSYDVKRWQLRQYEAWKESQRRPLERWMRQYIAFQWAEFLETVFWNIPALEPTVSLARGELARRQKHRDAAIWHQLDREAW